MLGFGDKTKDIKKEEGWTSIKDIISSINSAILDAGSQLDSSKGSHTFVIDSAKVEISIEIATTGVNQDGVQIRLPYFSKQNNENYSENDLCKLTYNMQRKPVIQLKNEPTSSGSEVSSSVTNPGNTDNSGN